MTFQTVGIWPENADGSDVNAVSRNLDGSLLASADDWGRVKLFSHPASQPRVILVNIYCFLLKKKNYNFFSSLLQTLSHIYSGHSSHVTSVEFMHDSSRLISTGGNDTSVMQWVVA